MVGTTQTQEQLPVRARIMRTVCLAVPVTVVLFAIFVITGIGGARGGWLLAPAIAAPAMAAVGSAGWGRGRGRRVATATLAIGGIALGLWVAQESPLGSDRLRAAMSSISVPAGFERTGTVVGGNSMCFDECPSHSRSWTVVGDVEKVQAQLRLVLEREGFTLKDRDPSRETPGTAEIKDHRGRLGLHVEVDSRFVWRGDERLSAAAGQVGVTATLDTYSGY